MQISRFRIVLLWLVLAAPGVGLAAGNATVFALKRGTATARVGDNSKNLSPGVDIPQGALVEVPEGTLGIKLSNGTPLYFPSGSSFRVVPPVEGGPSEIVLLTGAVSATPPADVDLLIRTATGTVEIGGTASVVSYVSAASSAPGTLLVRTSTGGVKVTPVSGAVITLNKESQVILSRDFAPAISALTPAMVADIRGAIAGNGGMLHSAAYIPDEFLPKVVPVVERKRPEIKPKSFGQDRANESKVN